MRTPDGRVVLDMTGRVPGRGAYLCADGRCWQRALEKGALARALSTTLPSELRAALEAGPSPSPTTTPGGARGQE